MILTTKQNDSLAELINISFSRSAASLSELTGRRVLVEAPQVQVVPMNELSSTIGRFLQGEIATVHQIFTGPVSGDVFLLFRHEAAVRLSSLMTDQSSIDGKLDASLSEVLTEVGNILLNACLGMFGNLLSVRVSFSIPRLHLDTLNQVMNAIRVEQQELRYALVASTSFQVKDTAIEGYLVFVLGVTSMEKLLNAVETLG